MVNEPQPAPPPRQPMFNNQPAIVLWLAGAIIAAHIWRLFVAPPDIAAEFVARFAVVPLAYEDGLTLENLPPLFGHGFLHDDQLWFHIVVNMLMLFVVSGAVVRRLGAAGGGAWRYLALFFGSSVGGAAFYILFNRGSDIPSIGASDAVCGIFAAYLMGARWDWRASLRDPQVRNAGLWFLGLNVGLAFVLRQFNVLPIAWEAHLGGFIAGMALFPFLAPKLAMNPENWRQR